LEERSSRSFWTLLGSNRKEYVMEFDRTMQTTGTLAFLGVALSLLVALGASARPMDVQCGDVLDVDGGQYRLNGDLACPLTGSGAAVTITGDGVHFNLRGYTITRDDGSGRSLQAGIVVRGANAHIHGGSIVDINCPDVAVPSVRQDCAGIFLGEAPGVRINGMSLRNNTVGIISFSAGGVVGNADGARIHGNDITENLRGGIILSGFGGATAEGAKITGNDLSRTAGLPGAPSFGAVVTSDGVSLIGNSASDCATGGILLVGNAEEGWAERNTIRDNVTLDNGVFGIHADAFQQAFRPRNNLIQSNTSLGNGVNDLGEFIPGVGPFADCLNTWKDNDFGIAGQGCVD
jgi:hypothetical protein